MNLARRLHNPSALTKVSTQLVELLSKLLVAEVARCELIVVGHHMPAAQADGEIAGRGRDVLATELA